MFNLHLSPEQLEFRDTVRDFVEEEVKPVTLKADRLDLGDRTPPVEVLRKASQVGLATTATRDGDHWIINGAKDCVANGPIAKLIAVEAQTDKGTALIMVPRDTPGLTVSEQPGPRWYHGSCGQLALKDVRVPAGNLL